MKIYVDLHIHGPYAQACSRNTTIELMEKNAGIKGLNLLGTGDAQHPKWNKILNGNLTEDENGILWTKNKFPFIWTTEISLAYTQNGKGRRIHHVVLLPNKETVSQFTEALLKKGRIDYDGRPIFGMSSIEFMDMLLSISKEIEVIPAHAWTSWMSIFGSKSGFDSVEECFEEKAKYIHALETGISSTPSMNRKISKLDKYNLVSFSDPHSMHPWRLGRESTILDINKLTYKNILNSIRTSEGLAGTIEANPEYGKYHIDGHRACGVVLQPEETKKLKGICPKCKSPLTIGVAYRVEQLADREKPKNVPYFKEVLPLHELISALYNIKLLNSKKIQEIYGLLIKNFENEYKILLEVSFEELKKVVHEKLVNLIILNRENKLVLQPGADGVYGKILIDKTLIKGSQSKLDIF